MGANGTGDVRKLLVEVTDSRALMKNYLADAPNGGIVVDTPPDVREGDVVELTCRIGSGDSVEEIVLRGAVLWRRRCDAHRVLAGIGFFASEVEKRERLLGSATAAPSRITRARPRYPVAMRVTYRTATDFVVDYIRNLSSGGAFVASERPPPLGERVLLKLHPPGVRDPIEITGQVAWRRPGEGFGVKFTPESDYARTRIEQLVRSIEIGLESQANEPIFEEVTPY